MIQSYIEMKGFQLDNLLTQSRIAFEELQTLEAIGGLEIIIFIYSATCSLPASQGMNFFTTNIKDMDISQVVAIKLYQRLKLWRAEAEKLIAEDLSNSTLEANVSDDDVPLTINSNN